MIPKQPPRDGQPGFLYLPPYRVHGISVAGEQTTITVPEFDLTFDMGQCTRASLATPLIALSHAHMDHVGGLPYWFSQRHFQKLEGGRVLCHPDTAGPLRQMLGSWVDVERQRTPHEVHPTARFRCVRVSCSARSRRGTPARASASRSSRTVAS
jgi:ribonuclease Z